MILIVCAIVAAAALLFVYRDIVQPGGNTERGVLALFVLVAAIIVALGPVYGDTIAEHTKAAH